MTKEALKINLLLILFSFFFHLIEANELFIISLTVSLFLIFISILICIKFNFFQTNDELINISIERGNLKKFNKILSNKKVITSILPIIIAKNNQLEIMKNAINSEKINFNYGLDEVIKNSTQEMKNLLWKNNKIKKILEKNYHNLYIEMQKDNLEKKINQF